MDSYKYNYSFNRFIFNATVYDYDKPLKIIIEKNIQIVFLIEMIYK
jgi:hypothetical protein